MNATSHPVAVGGSVVVLGSVNLDTSLRVSRLPLEGETIVALDTRSGLGGKGANQAVAAARAGARVTLLAAIGSDDRAVQLRRVLASFGIDLAHLLVIDGASGAATILVSDEGENVIVVTPGSNSAVLPGYLDLRDEVITNSSVLVLQGEIPAITVRAAIARARRARTRVVLNLAPYLEIGDALTGADPLVVNEVEASQLVGAAVTTIEQAIEAARELTGRAKSVVITLGADGAVLASDGHAIHYPAVAVDTISDSTGAGDAFVGVLAACLAGGGTLADALPVALHAGALAVQSAGAAEGYPDFRPLFSHDMEVAR